MPPCVWRRNCADHFIRVHPEGHVAQCDCRGAGYPEHRFGAVFETRGLCAILEAGLGRERLLIRYSKTGQNQGRIDCDFPVIRHGWRPIRA